MSSHYVPFTSNLEMWSPSPSMTFDYTTRHNGSSATTTTAYTTVYESSPRIYHHDPVFYPSAACLVCGQPHYTTPHTIMNYYSNIEATSMKCPEPSEPPSLKPPPVLKLNSHRYHGRGRGSNSFNNNRNSRFKVKKHKKTILNSFKLMFRKFYRICNNLIKLPVTSSNVYPVIKRQQNHS